ncbi:MAG: NAD(P)H-dependent glycerol-3-phosphate dehydrogenase [Clostridia bacterium]|nr:NAD(P)H-dependent glycerol-3-phosphate dehydrogenase [Clostridia bacterium]
MRVAVIGSGSFGVALSCLLNNNGHSVKIWSRSDDEIRQINEDRVMERYLPGLKIPDGIFAYKDMGVAVKDIDLVVLAVPSVAIRECSKNLSEYLTNQIIVNVAKGIEEATLSRLSEVIYEETKSKKIAILSGPSHAEEVSKCMPTVVAVSSNDREICDIVSDVFMNEYFRVYPNDDLVGVELGGALKNVIALCAGVSDGLGFGDNTKAGLITRGLAEITRLGVKMGGRQETFSGLTGLGDLVVTCASVHSRNHRAGELIGKGYNPKDAVAEVKMVVEGVNTAKAALKLGEKYGVELPIIEQANKVLFENKNPKDAVLDLMVRTKKYE